MLSLSTNAVAAKAKSMYGGRLTQEQYDELLKKRTVGEVASYLKAETPYKEALSDIRENTIHRGELEQLLRQAAFMRNQKLVRYVDGKNKEFYSFVVKEQEIQLLLQRIHALNSEVFEAFNTEIPYYLEKYASFNLRALMDAKDFETLLEVLAHSGYDTVLKPFKPQTTSQRIDYVSCERELYQYFYRFVFDTIATHFKGKTRKELNTIFESQVELVNIAKIYRYKKFFDIDSKMIYESLIKTHQRMSTHFLKRLSEASDDQELLKMLATSHYHMFVDDADYVFIEYYAQKVKYNLGKRYIRFSMSAPMVFTTFYMMQKIEVENLINIIEGVRYGVPSESIEKMLII